MSVSQRVQTLQSGAEQISVLAEYLKNPKLIEQLQEDIKALNSLTVDEESKLLQARSDLKEHDKKISDLKKERDQLEADKSAHADYVTKTSAQFEHYSETLDAQNKSLIQAESALKNRELDHEREKKQLGLFTDTIKRSHEDIQEQLSKREIAVKKAEESVAAAAVRVESDRKKLAEKLRLLSE